MTELNPQLGVLPHNHNDLPGQGSALSYEALKDKPDIPTDSQLDALAGTSGTPSSSNKYVTNDDVSASATASKIARRDANGELIATGSPTTSTSAISKEYADKVNLYAVASDTNQLRVQDDTSPYLLLPKDIYLRLPGTYRLKIYWRSQTGAAAHLNVYTVQYAGTGGTEATHLYYDIATYSTSFAYQTLDIRVKAGEIIRIAHSDAYTRDIQVNFTPTVETSAFSAFI